MWSLTCKAASGALLGHTQQGLTRESPVLVICLDPVFLLVWTALAIGETNVDFAVLHFTAHKDTKRN
jgi:hypothetical protein